MKNDDDNLKPTELVKEKKKRKSSSLMKKLKLRSRRSSSATEEIRSSSSEERKTPEGDDHLKSASETNLTEVSWKSADNLPTAEESSVRTKSLENLNAMPPFGELILDEQEIVTV